MSGHIVTRTGLVMLTDAIKLQGKEHGEFKAQ